jgi:DNA-damage-inducible protein J
MPPSRLNQQTLGRTTLQVSGDTMASDTVVRARIDGQVKERAAKVLADMGLSISDAIRLLLVRVAAEKALPFEINAPNAETQAAMAELEQGGGKSFDSVPELMADLNAED